MASIYDKASLVLIPSGTKTSKVYSQVPTNGDGDFTFSRSTAATRVNASGNIEKETQNLLLQSNQFDTTWIQANVSVTGGQSGYDGSSDAWLITKDNTQYRYIYQTSPVSGICTLSLYAKAGTLSQVTLRDGVTQGRVEFNLSNGSVDYVRTENIVAYDISSVGNDWYRCQVSFNGVAATIQFYPDFGGTTAGSIYIQDAQLEQGLVARDYIETTTTAIYGGITDNVPRLDYQGSCPALLLEPQRSNIMPSSEDIDSVWSKLRVSVENNSTTSPEGFVNAGKIIATAVAGTHASYDTLSSSVTAGNDYFISCFVKKATTKYIRLNEGYTGAYVTFNFDDQTTDLQNGASDVLLEEHANGWYRLGFKFTADSSGNSQFALYINDDNNNTSYTGAGEAVYLWGAQIEAGSYATSYIPTYGSAVTRNRDVCGDAGNASTFNDSKGVLYAEISALANDGTFRNISLSNGTTTQAVRIYYRSSNDQITFLISSSSGGGVTTSIPSATDFIKVAAKYDTDTIKLFVNGVLTNTLSSLTMPTGLNQLDFDIANVLPFYGNAKQVLYFPTALTDQEAIDLTTID